MTVDHAEVTVEFVGGPFDGVRRAFEQSPPERLAIPAPVLVDERNPVPSVDVEASWMAGPSERDHVYELVDGRYVYRGIE